MKNIFFVFMFMFMNYACSVEEKTDPNPFFSEFNTPFGVPPFDKLDSSYFIPAFEKGILDQQSEIENITKNNDQPSFENTIEAFNNSGKLLARVTNVFFNLNSANSNVGFQKIDRFISPKITNHKDNIYLNNKLFQRIKSVYENRQNLNLSAEQQRAVEKYYSDFVRKGANLSTQDKEKLRLINQQLSINKINFQQNLLAETNNNFKLIIENIDDLKGLPQGEIDAAAEKGKNEKMEGKWIFTLQKPSLIPFLQYAQNRSLREKIYRGYYMRGNNNNKFDNKEILLTMMNLRLERAKLLGYKTHAEYVISENMAKTPDKVYEFLNNMMVPALKVATKDRDEMQKIINQEGGKFKLESWDWWYYAEKLKKQKYDFDESEVRPYFALSNVRDGMFLLANKLWGISFTRIDSIPVYNPEVEAFEAKDENGSHLGVLYLDYYPRDGKRMGAWCDAFRNQYYENGKKVYPVITTVFNFTRPTKDTPALLTWDEVNTLFHEFGHALHGLFTDGRYIRIAGNLPFDMVELPSQIMENWAGQPEMLKLYAKHYKTGEILPAALQEKIKNSLVFNEGFNVVEYVAASILDLDWHNIENPVKEDVEDFEAKSMEKTGLLKEILPRYRSTYFSHIIGEYDAGYYAYLWAAVLDADAFDAFVKSGDIFNKSIAEKYRKIVLTEGGNDEGMAQYIKFRGQEPSPEPLLKRRGLK